MPGKPDKRFRIRVRVLDGKPRDQKELNRLKSNQFGMPHLDILDAERGIEFIICAPKEPHLEQVRAKLAAVGLEELVGGSTSIGTPAVPRPANTHATHRGRPENRGGAQRAQGSRQGSARQRKQEAEPYKPDIKKKPYAFVPLPDKPAEVKKPIWHDGTKDENSKERFSGEVRFELTTLTPMLVGWERRQVGEDKDEPWPVPANIDGVKEPLGTKKSVLCPLRAPWGKRPVVIPGDSLKGLLRHELGALLGAPMERVAERSYSYRPNLEFPDNPDGRRLEPRLARVLDRGTITLNDEQWPIPLRLELIPMAKKRGDDVYYTQSEEPSKKPVPRSAERYKGGMGGGVSFPEEMLPNEAARIQIRTHVVIKKRDEGSREVQLSPEVISQYRRTLCHLLNGNEGHFSSRHPYIGRDGEKQERAVSIVAEAARAAFQRGSIVCVEWDKKRERIVSFGWHYYYRWAYQDTVRERGGRGLIPHPDESRPDDSGAPKGLSPVRRLFGYAVDEGNPGVAGIGENDHTQLMGRVSINAALEVVEAGDTDKVRFLGPTFLKELGMPRPSAVEHYLKQPDYPNSRGSDNAMLRTYGDTPFQGEYDTPGELAGRKFYLDRAIDENDPPWEDSSDTNRLNERSTLALEAASKGRKFRFTLRFRDLEPEELAYIVVALCPDQFQRVLGGSHEDGYCSKLGYARPLGWGSVNIEAKALLWLEADGESPSLRAEDDLDGWVKGEYKSAPMQGEWLAIHRREHPDAGDYPKPPESRGKDPTLDHHTRLRGEHSGLRRYKRT